MLQENSNGQSIFVDILILYYFVANQDKMSELI